MPPPGRMPTLAWVSAKTARWEAMRMSIPRASSSPPVMTGPFTAGVIALLIFGIRYEGQNLLDQMRKEAATASGAILPDEVPILASPWQRLRQRLQALSRQGLPGYFRGSRLQTAQLDLAMERWHRARREIDSPLEAELLLRDRVQAIRAGVRPPT